MQTCIWPSWCHCHSLSCFSKIQIGFTFLVPAHPGSPGKRATKRVCVCVCLKPSLKLKFKQKDKVTQRTAYNSAVNARNTGKAGHGTVQSWTPVHCWQYAGLHGVVHMLTVSWRDSWSCERSEWFKSSEFFNSSATNTQPHTHTTVRRLVARDYPGRPAACSNGKLITVTGEFSVNTEIH